MGGRHHLHPDRTRLPLPGGDHRLGEPGGAGLAAVEYDGLAFCVDALDEALARFGRPEIFNTDQGSQFTSAAFTGRLATAGIRISMDGRGRWMDNVFIERLWRSLKYEDVYLKGYADGREAKAGTAHHQALGNRTPMAVLARWRDGAKAVDLDGQARTLPTCPQPQQQQTALLAA